MDNIIPFPKKYQQGKRSYRIPLYSDYDVDLVLFCINAFGETEKRVGMEDLGKLDPIDVKKCIDKAVDSSIVSIEAKAHLQYIINSIEEIIL